MLIDTQRIITFHGDTLQDAAAMLRDEIATLPLTARVTSLASGCDDGRFSGVAVVDLIPEVEPASDGTHTKVVQDVSPRCQTDYASDIPSGLGHPYDQSYCSLSFAKRSRRSGDPEWQRQAINLVVRDSRDPERCLQKSRLNYKIKVE